jgi:hypothetical protein
MRGAPRLGVSVPRGTTVDERMGSFGRPGLHEGARRFVWTHGFTKGRDTPKDVTVHDGDLWSPYKRTRAHNQGRKIWKTRRARRALWF